MSVKREHYLVTAPLNMLNFEDDRRNKTHWSWPKKFYKWTEVNVCCGFNYRLQNKEGRFISGV